MVDIKLGEKALYPDRYDASLLHPIARSETRGRLGIGETLPFIGEDIWTGFELSWLDSKGKPVVAIAEFRFPAGSPAIIESKSFKYYLNSFNQTAFNSIDEVRAVLVRDLSVGCGAPVDVSCFGIDSYPRVAGSFPGVCVDELSVDITCYHPDSSLLDFTDNDVEQQQLYSHLLKSNCPVTGQPDWATVWICCSGRELAPESLLKYVVSYRQHQDFHENCVEKMFTDLMATGQLKSLLVYARYTRRGGLDINPLRATPDWAEQQLLLNSQLGLDQIRIARQ